MKFFIVSTPGFENLTLSEIHAQGIYKTIPDARDSESLELEGEMKELYCANLFLRTATRVLVRMGTFYSSTFSELRKKAGRLPWEIYIPPDHAVALRVTCHHSRLYHSDAVAERILAVISDRLGQRVKYVRYTEQEESPPPQLIVVRMSDDQCTISMDSSGAALHRRGYRQALAKAPLRETLAAGMILASGWDGGSPFLDPFCGSGTLPIEAALIASNTPPGRHRRFAFMDWPGFDSALWENLLVEADAKITNALPIIQASDRDAGAIQMAKDNARRAGVANHIQFTCQSFSAINPPQEQGWIVTNPPYGVRISSGKDLRNLYSHLGDVLRQKCPDWIFSILCSDDFLMGHTHLPVEQRMSFANGGLRVTMSTGRIPADR